MSGELSLGDRMKRYELPTDTRLTRNIPAIIRIDGKAFHTWTKGMLRPWDPFGARFIEIFEMELRH